MIKTVMRYSGPRMLLYHPIDALIHLLHETKMVRILGVILGWLVLILGVVGIVVPGLPTTPLVLLSAFLFAQSSPRFYKWLSTNRYFGNVIKTWERDRVIPKGFKRKALTLLAVTITVSIIVLPVMAAKILLGIIGVSVGIYLSRIPEEK